MITVIELVENSQATKENSNEKCSYKSRSKHFPDNATFKTKDQAAIN